MKNKEIITIGIPKGYLFKNSMDFLRKHGINFTNYSERQLLIKDSSGKYQCLVLRPSDVPVYVEHGIVDVGISGLDTIKESNCQLVVLHDLGFGYCRLAIAQEAGLPLVKFKNGMKVATKFVNCAKKYFKNIGIKADIIKLYGSVELAAITGLSDIIIDLVATGSTIKENNLQETHTIFESTAHLMVNNAFYSLNYPFIRILLGK